MEHSQERREYLCLIFVQKCIKNDLTEKMIPSNDKLHKMDIRSKEKFKAQFANTERLKNSAIIYMQKLLNEKT